MSPRNIEMPVETVTTEHGDTKSRFTHPAFAMIGASRVTCGGSGEDTGQNLFGSDFTHRAYMTIRIKPASLSRSLYSDWFFAEGRPYIEVALSEAQWATMISTPNSGDGVPCTVEYVNGKEIPGIPPRREDTVYTQELQEKTEKMLRLVEKAMADIDIELAGVSGKKRDAVKAQLARLHQDIRSNLPFLSKSYAKHWEKIKEKAKIEVHAIIMGAATRLGLARLKEGDVPILQLVEGERVSDDVAGCLGCGGEGDAQTPCRECGRGLDTDMDDFIDVGKRRSTGEIQTNG